LSKFRIYREGSADPRSTGRQNRKMYMAYTFLMFLLALTFNIHINSDKKISSAIMIAVVAVMAAATILLVYEMKRQSRSLKKIGILEFTKTSLKKQIGDLSSSHPYTEIRRIEIERHLHALSVSVSKSGSLTHLLRIIYRDKAEENFIISDKSIDFSQKIGISDTLKTLRSTAGLEYQAKNN
jgi:hypothetical protein